MNRYRQELQADPDREAAMTRALTAAFGSITGSSVTTIVGLLMLVFMRFKIGMDLGIVLAKGVLCSLLCVFTVLPGLILWADKLVRKTTKKPRAPKRARRSVLAALGRFSYRWRGAIAAAFVLLFAGTYVLQLSTQIAYTLTDTDPVAEVFPPDNPIVVLYNNADEDAVAALADRLEADPNVKSAMSYSTTLGRQYTATQMADIVGALDASIPVSADMLGMIYYDVYSGGRAVTIPAGQFLRFLTEHVANNAAFAPYLDAGMTANLQTLQKFTDPAALTQQRTAESLADFLGMDAADAKQLLLYYYTQHGDASTGGMTLPVFSDFLVNEVLTDPTMADMVDASAREQAAMLQTFTDVSAMTTPRGCGEIAQMLGMDEETVRRVTDPFYTTRTTRKVGLGLPLLKMTAQATGGEMSIASKPGEGTTVRVTFGLSHIDRPPMGDVPGVLYTLVLMNPTTDFRFTLDYDGKTFALDTREVREAVAPIPLDHPEISAWIRDCLKQNIDELHGGVFL